MARATAASRRAWLQRTAKIGGWRNRAAMACLVGDGLAAIGFAFALAGALAALPAGLVAATPWLLGGVGASLLRGACGWGSAKAGAAASTLVRTDLRCRLTVACFLQPGGGSAGQHGMALAVDAVETMDGYVARFLPAKRVAGVVPLLVLLATAMASPISAVILAGTLIPFVLVMALAGGAAADQARAQFAALTRLSGLFADRVRGLPTVLAFQAEQRETARLGVAADQLRQRTMRVLRVAFVSSAGLEFFAALSVALVAVYAGFNLLGLLPFPAGRLDLAHAFFVLALAPEFYAPMRRLAAAYHDQQAAEAVADPMMDYLVPSTPIPAPLFADAPRIRFEAVSVRYPGEDRLALRDVELDIAAGEIVALLGPSGSGKTTLLNLLLGLAPLAEGEVWIDDQALSQFGSVVASIAWMGQNPVIVPGTIADNIALSRQDAAPVEIALVAAQAGLDTMLSARPAGLDTLVDERGSGLSGGERRRIALARALLKPAPILLLDEPTAHLNAAAEAALVLSIQRAARGRTTLIATHSEAVAAIADRVFRLELV
jgi:ATP-binding cassette subfamily C protein CydD